MIKWIARGIAFSLGGWLGAQLILRVLMRYKPFAIPTGFGPLVASSVRYWYRDPVRVVDFTGVRKNMAVLDAGCGKGVFTQELAIRVGESGVVHAIDLQAEMIEAAQRRIANVGLNNVRFSLSGLEKLPLESETIDAVVMISVLPMTVDKRMVLRELKRVLKPGGTLVLGEELLDPEYVRPSTARNWAETAGFQMVAHSGNGIAYLLKLVKPVSPLDVLDDSQL